MAHLVPHMSHDGDCEVLNLQEYDKCFCAARAAAPALLEACKAMLEATDELLTEYVSKKRAANWGVINQAMVDASAAIAKARAATRAAKGESNG